MLMISLIKNLNFNEYFNLGSGLIAGCATYLIIKRFTKNLTR